MNTRYLSLDFDFLSASTYRRLVDRTSKPYPQMKNTISVKKVKEQGAIIWTRRASDAKYVRDDVVT